MGVDSNFTYAHQFYARLNENAFGVNGGLWGGAVTFLFSESTTAAALMSIILRETYPEKSARAVTTNH